nr:MAG TPA: hypothetical protein [Caudoviricetes sp.]
MTELHSRHYHLIGRKTPDKRNRHTTGKSIELFKVVLRRLSYISVLLSLW